MIVQIVVAAVSQREALDGVHQFLDGAERLHGKRYRVFADRICQRRAA
ncbi:hypothetical protein [Propionivibrio sp.]